jgi:predicted tellurium resistance membrane protein TerC
MAELLTTDSLVAFLSLTLMEVVLGIDNVVFIAILSSKLPANQQGRARIVGLSLAVLLRIGMLFGISWIIKLTSPLFMALGNEISAKDLIMISGGLFLIAKATHEIYDKLERLHEVGAAARTKAFMGVVAQIVSLDVVFSIDSVLTAVGMVQRVEIMIAAVLVAVGIMMAFSGGLSAFVNRHPSLKILALSFLLLIGVMLVAEGLGSHINKGYIYFAMAFSLLVELFNMRYRRKKHAPVTLHQAFEDTGSITHSSER